MTQDPVGYAGADANIYRYVSNAPVDYIDSSGLTKGGKQRIKVTGIPSNVTREQLEKLIKEAKACGASAKHIRKLEGWLKVVKRGGMADIRLITTAAGTLLTVGEITSIINHGGDRVDLNLVSTQTNDDGSATFIYFGTILKKTGFLGFGPEKRAGNVLYALTIPKDQLGANGCPGDQLSFKLYNIDAGADLLRQKGITEEWIGLPDGIDSIDKLSGNGKGVLIP
jgi:hypothetical protein